MLCYISSFFACLLIDKTSNHKIDKYLLVLFVVVILCFGYMVGSDWREYERIYDGTLEMDKFYEREFGFVFFIRTVSKIISDFWVFSALVKIIYLYSTIRMFSLFTDKKWSVLSLCFAYYFLFMIIDCPLRFMLASTIVQFSVEYYLKRKYVIFVLLCTIAFTFHNTILIPVIIILLSAFARKLVGIKNVYLYIIYLVAIVLSMMSQLYSNIYQVIINTLFFSSYAEIDRYSTYLVQDFSTLGSIKNLLIGFFVIYYKPQIIKGNHGNVVFYFSYITIVLQSLFLNIPTTFRLIILSGYFIPIAMITIFNRREITIGSRRFMKIAIGFLLFVVMLRNVSAWNYTPYSNSIYYILTDHLPYSYRYNHNFRDDTNYN